MKIKNNKEITTLAICVTVVFVILGLLTIVAVLTDDEDEKDDKETVTQTDKDYKSDTEKKDSVVINKPLEGDPYKELDELIGLEDVKEEVRSLANFVKVQKMRQEKGLKTPKMSYHLVFTGSPGTGKTTVARIVARIYKDLGILKQGHTVETDRSGLVAEYVGQTAIKTNALVDSALNGVLFIDEAYALVPDANNSGDYGQEAISTLLKRMEDD
ncbi:MAG: AAA family ATPase, partial [Bacteroidaceae bacterium]|nr:AAA family ATPase [Bacteroidaceae bacterium]